MQPLIFQAIDWVINDVQINDEDGSDDMNLQIILQMTHSKLKKNNSI